MASRALLDKFAQWGTNKTLRQLTYESTEFESSIELIGIPIRWRTGWGKSSSKWVGTAF